jgi:hypothetical protein
MDVCGILAFGRTAFMRLIVALAAGLVGSMLFGLADGGPPARAQSLDDPYYDRDYDQEEWDRRRDWDRERAERRREEDVRREEQRRNRQLDRRNRELDRRNRELDERNREIARRQRERSDEINGGRHRRDRGDDDRAYRKPSLSVVCAPENGQRKCRLKGHNAFRGD